MALTFPGLPRLLEEFSSPLDPSLFLSSVRRVFLQNSALGARSLTPETAPTPKVLIPSAVKSHPRHREIRAIPSLWESQTTPRGRQKRKAKKTRVERLKVPEALSPC